MHMNMRSSIHYLFLIVALPATNAFYIYLDAKSLTCSGDPFTQLVMSHECVEPEFYEEEQFYGPNCYWGDHVMISGSVIAESNFPANGQVVAIPEFLSWQRYDVDDMQLLGRGCEVLDPMDGQTCGERGAYGFNIHIVLPYKQETWHQRAIDSVTSITIHFHNSITCQEARTSHNLSIPKKISGLMGFGVAFGVLFAVWHGKRCPGNQQQNEGDDSDDPYIEMGQQPGQQNSPRATDPVVQWRRRDSVIDANEIMDQQRVMYSGGIDMDQYRSRV